MNQFKHHAGGTMAQPVPLFASSWVALYTLLRQGFVKEPCGRSVSVSSGDGKNASLRDG